MHRSSATAKKAGAGSKSKRWRVALTWTKRPSACDGLPGEGPLGEVLSGLAERCGLSDLVASKLTLPALGGVNVHLKVPALVAGMVAGADSIDDMDLLRHGGMDRLFGGVRAPSTLGRSCGRSPSAMCDSSTVSRP